MSKHDVDRDESKMCAEDVVFGIGLILTAGSLLVGGYFAFATLSNSGELVVSGDFPHFWAPAAVAALVVFLIQRQKNWLIVELIICGLYGTGFGLVQLHANDYALSWQWWSLLALSGSILMIASILCSKELYEPFEK